MAQASIALLIALTAVLNSLWLMLHGAAVLISSAFTATVQKATIETTAVMMLEPRQALPLYCKCDRGGGGGGQVQLSVAG